MTTAARLARCPVRGCPARYRTGCDRLCHGHAADDATKHVRAEVAAELLAEPAGLQSGARSADASR